MNNQFITFKQPPLSPPHHIILMYNPNSVLLFQFTDYLPLCISGCWTTKLRGRCKCHLQITALLFWPHCHWCLLYPYTFVVVLMQIPAVPKIVMCLIIWSVHLLSVMQQTEWRLENGVCHVLKVVSWFWLFLSWWNCSRWLSLIFFFLRTLPRTDMVSQQWSSPKKNWVSISKAKAKLFCPPLLCCSC